MNFIFILVFILIILTIIFFNYLIHRRKKDTYHKAGKKWDRIVKELSNRN